MSLLNKFPNYRIKSQNYGDNSLPTIHLRLMVTLALTLSIIGIVTSAQIDGIEQDRHRAHRLMFSGNVGGQLSTAMRRFHQDQIKFANNDETLEGVADELNSRAQLAGTSANYNGDSNVYSADNVGESEQLDRPVRPTQFFNNPVPRRRQSTIENPRRIDEPERAIDSDRRNYDEALRTVTGSITEVLTDNKRQADSSTGSDDQSDEQNNSNGTPSESLQQPSVTLTEIRKESQGEPSQLEEASANKRPEQSRLSLLLGRKGASPFSKTDLAIEYLRNILRSKHDIVRLAAANSALKSLNTTSTMSSSKSEGIANNNSTSPIDEASAAPLVNANQHDQSYSPLFSPADSMVASTPEDDDDGDKSSGSISLPNVPQNSPQIPQQQSQSKQQQQQQQPTGNQKLTGEYREGNLYRAPSEPLIGTPLGGEYDETLDESRRGATWLGASQTSGALPTGGSLSSSWQQMESPLRGHSNNVPLTTNGMWQSHLTKINDTQQQQQSGIKSETSTSTASPVVMEESSSTSNRPEPMRSLVQAPKLDTANNRVKPAPFDQARPRLSSRDHGLKDPKSEYILMPHRTGSRPQSDAHSMLAVSLDSSLAETHEGTDVGLTRSDIDAIRQQLMMKRVPMGSSLHTTTAENRSPLMLDALHVNERLPLATEISLVNRVQQQVHQQPYQYQHQPQSQLQQQLQQQLTVSPAASTMRISDLSPSASVPIQMSTLNEQSYERWPILSGDSLESAASTDNESVDKLVMDSEVERDQLGDYKGSSIEQPEVFIDSLSSYLRSQAMAKAPSRDPQNDPIIQRENQQTQEQSQNSPFSHNPTEQLEVGAQQAVRLLTVQNNNNKGVNMSKPSITEPSYEKKASIIKEAPVIKEAPKDGRKNLIVYLNHPRSQSTPTDTNSDGYALARAISTDGNDEKLQSDTTPISTPNANVSNNDGLSVVVVGDAHKYKKIVMLISSKSGGLKLIPIVKDRRR